MDQSRIKQSEAAQGKEHIQHLTRNIKHLTPKTYKGTSHLLYIMFHIDILKSTNKAFDKDPLVVHDKKNNPYDKKGACTLI